MRLLLNWLVVVLLWPCSLAMASEPLVVAVDQSNPPFMYSAQGEARGLYPAMLSAVFERMGTPVKVITVPWKRALSMGESGMAGVGGIYKTPERLKIYDYSDEIYQEKLLLYVPHDSTLTFDNLADLKGKHIGVIRGWSYGEDFDKARESGVFSADETASDEANFHKLVIGRLDAAIAIELSGQKLMNKPGLIGKVKALPTPVAVNATYLVFAKQKKMKQTLASFNGALQAMKSDSSLERVIRREIAR